MISPNGSMMVFSGSSSPRLAESIAGYLGISLGRAIVDRFSDGEVQVEVMDNVRGRDIFIVQSTCNPADAHLMELLIMVDAMKRASARRVTAVMPYMGYSRQDRRILSARPD